MSHVRFIPLLYSQNGKPLYDSLKGGVSDRTTKSIVTRNIFGLWGLDQITDSWTEITAQFFSRNINTETTLKNKQTNKQKCFHR